MNIRPYQNRDADALMQVFRRNVPQAFAGSEEADYADFLTRMPVTYAVAELDGQVVGACGYYLPPDGEPARIVWIMSDPQAPGRGIGSALLNYCLSGIHEADPYRIIECRTSQVAYRFFERFGFQLQYTKPDFWAPGLDLYYMTRNHD